MAGFFGNLFDKIKSVFAPVDTPDFDGKIEGFQKKMDDIISDIMQPVASGNVQNATERFRELLDLLDPKKCNKIAATLSSNLDKNYTKIQLEQFASAILIGRNVKDCDENNEKCSDDNKINIANDNGKVSKRAICNAIAVHYIKILNLIAAILTAVNPVDNLCLNRIRNLLTVIDQDNKKGISTICDPDTNPVKGNILEESGMRELLVLYYFHLAQDAETSFEKGQVRRQLGFLVNTMNEQLYAPSAADVKKLMKKGNIGSIELETPSAENMANIVENLGEELGQKEEEPEKMYATKSNIENMKENIKGLKNTEQQRLQNIIDKIELLSGQISNIQNKTRTPDMEMENNNDIRNVSDISDIGTQSVNMIPSTSNVKNNSKKNLNVSKTLKNNNLNAAKLGNNAAKNTKKNNNLGLGMNSNLGNLATVQADVTEPVAKEADPQPTIPATMATAEMAPVATDPVAMEPVAMEPVATAPIVATEPTKQPEVIPVQQSAAPVEQPQQQGGANNVENNDENLNLDVKNNATNQNIIEAEKMSDIVANESVQNNKNAENINKTINKLSKMENQMKNPVLSGFIDFVNKYSHITELDSKKLDNVGMGSLVGMAFKTSSKYDAKDLNTGKLFIGDADFKKFCSANTDDKNVININLDDAKFGELIQVYRDMKNKYLNNCESLLSVLENNILTKVGTEPQMRFTLKNIGYTDLVEQETNVRNTISAMYADCHRNYQEGIAALYNAFTSTPKTA